MSTAGSEALHGPACLPLRRQQGFRAAAAALLALPAVAGVRLVVPRSTRQNNINLVMVGDGQAFAYRQYLNRCDAREYLDAEHRAIRRRYGVWQVEGGITRPWDFRRSRKSQRLPN